MLTRSRATWVAYILLALYGYFLNILGPITPFLLDEFNLSYAISSLHFSAFAVGILIVGLAGHIVIYRLGRWLSLATGALGLGLGALLLVLGRSPFVTVAATFLMGSVGSLILAVVPPALSEEHGELRAVAISEANVLASLISAAAPFLVGWLAAEVAGWRLALVVAALLSIGIGAVLVRSGWKRADQLHSKPPAGRLPALFWFYWTALVLAVAVEFCMVFWSADYVESKLRLQKAGAAQTVSLFLVGMILGRWISSRVARFLSPRKLVLAYILTGALGFMPFWTTTSTTVALVSLAITGLGVAGLYPLILSLAIAASAGNESQAGARTTLASGTAILMLPLVLGRLADIAGLRFAFGVVAVLFALMFLMIAGSRIVEIRLKPGQ